MKKMYLSIQFKKHAITPENAAEYTPLSVRSEGDQLVYILKKGSGKERWRYTETMQEAHEYLSQGNGLQLNPKGLVQLRPNPNVPTSGLWND